MSQPTSIRVCPRRWPPGAFSRRRTSCATGSRPWPSPIDGPGIGEPPPRHGVYHSRWEPASVAPHTMMEYTELVLDSFEANMPSYNPRAIEPRWQRFWQENRTFRTPDRSDKSKFYILDM